MPANTDSGARKSAKGIDPAIRAAADALGMVRDTRLVIGQLNLLEYAGHGTLVDLEAATLGQPIEVSRYAYAVSYHFPASRLDYDGPNGVRTVRVVNKDRAWNEEKPGINPSASPSAAFRAQSIWLTPHARHSRRSLRLRQEMSRWQAVRRPSPDRQGGRQDRHHHRRSTVSYKTTFCADNRPERVEAVIKLPGGAPKKSRRSIRVTETAPALARGARQVPFRHILAGPDHSGNRRRQGLDITITEGWSNPYVIFPEPELLAKANEVPAGMLRDGKN
jgi:hypothetical protein